MVQKCPTGAPADLNPDKNLRQNGQGLLGTERNLYEPEGLDLVNPELYRLLNKKFVGAHHQKYAT